VEDAERPASHSVRTVDADKDCAPPLTAWKLAWPADMHATPGFQALASRQLVIAHRTLTRSALHRPRSIGNLDRCRPAMTIGSADALPFISVQSEVPVRALVVGLLAGVFLRLFYWSVRNEWPAAYSSVQSALEAQERERLSKYLLLRVAPVFLVGVFAAVTADRLHASTGIALTAMLLVEVAGSNGLAAARLLFVGRGRSPRGGLLSYHVAVAVVVVLGGLLALPTHRFIAAAVPKPAELPAAAWTGLFAAVLAVSARRLVGSSTNQDRDLDRGRSDVGEDLLRYARQAAARQDCDADVVEAILTVEGLQRPRWFRRLERLKGRVVAAGTYGVGQVSSPAPISDEASIDELCRCFRGYFPTRSGYGTVRTALFEARVEEHNPDPVFLGLVSAEYQRLVQYPHAKSLQTARDGRPEIEILPPVRVKRNWQLQGTAWLPDGEVLLAALHEGCEGPTRAEVTSDAPLGGRWRWQAEVPLNVWSVRVWGGQSPQPTLGDPNRTAQLDLSSY